MCCSPAAGASPGAGRCAATPPTRARRTPRARPAWLGPSPPACCLLLPPLLPPPPPPPGPGRAPRPAPAQAPPRPAPPLPGWTTGPGRALGLQRVVLGSPQAFPARDSVLAPRAKEMEEVQTAPKRPCFFTAVSRSPGFSLVVIKSGCRLSMCAVSRAVPAPEATRPFLGLPGGSQFTVWRRQGATVCPWVPSSKFTLIY